jgi:hypothetical protein
VSAAKRSSLAGIGKRSETIARSGAAVQGATSARPVSGGRFAGTGAQRRRERMSHPAAHRLPGAPTMKTREI